MKTAEKDRECRRQPRLNSGTKQLKGARWIALSCALISATAGCATNLSTAIDQGDVGAVRNALSSGANAQGNYWTSMKSPASRAVDLGHLEVLQVLVDHGAEVHPGFMIRAARHGHAHLLPFLLDHGASMTACATMPPIGYAIANRDYELVKTLVELGSPLSIQCSVPMNPEYTFSALLFSTVLGDQKIVEYLLRQGAQPNQLRTDGKTPIAIAAEQGNLEIVRLLLAAGAYHTYKTQQYQPIEYADANGHDEVVGLLRYAGAAFPKRQPTPAANPTKESNLSDLLADVIVVAGSLWLIYEGSRYGYDESEVLSTETDSESSLSTDRNWQDSSVDAAECNNDLQCGALELCLKKPGHLRGICVHDADFSRLKGSRSPVDSAFPRRIEPVTETDCSPGYRWDPIYQTCVQ